MLTEALEAVDPWPPDFSQSDIDYLNEQPADERDAVRLDLEHEYGRQALAEARVHHAAARMALDRFAASAALLFTPPPRSLKTTLRSGRGAIKRLPEELARRRKRREMTRSLKRRLVELHEEVLRRIEVPADDR